MSSLLSLFVLCFWLCLLFLTRPRAVESVTVVRTWSNDLLTHPFQSAQFSPVLVPVSVILQPAQCLLIVFFPCSALLNQPDLVMWVFALPCFPCTLLLQCFFYFRPWLQFSFRYSLCLLCWYCVVTRPSVILLVFGHVPFRWACVLMCPMLHSVLWFSCFSLMITLSLVPSFFVVYGALLVTGHARALPSLSQRLARETRLLYTFSQILCQCLVWPGSPTPSSGSPCYSNASLTALGLCCPFRSFPLMSSVLPCCHVRTLRILQFPLRTKKSTGFGPLLNFPAQFTRLPFLSTPPALVPHKFPYS